MIQPIIHNYVSKCIFAAVARQARQDKLSGEISSVSIFHQFCTDYSLFFLTAAGRLKRFSRHPACSKTKKSRNVNENAKDMNRREQIIEQIYIVECSQRYSRHVKCRLERFKRPAAVK